MTTPTPRVFMYENKHGMPEFLFDTVSYLEKQDSRKLQPKTVATAIGKRKGIPAAAVKYSIQWYLEQVAEFEAKGVKLPSIPILYLHRTGKKTKACPHGLYRFRAKDNGVLLGILFADDVISVVYSSPKLVMHLGYIEKLAKTLNETWYAPTEDMLRVIIHKHKVACDEEMLAENKPAVNAPRVALKEVAMIPQVAKQGPDPMTQTRLGDIYASSIALDNKLADGINNAIDVKKQALLQNGNVLASNERIRVTNENIVASADHDKEALLVAYKNNQQMRGAFLNMVAGGPAVGPVAIAARGASMGGAVVAPGAGGGDRGDALVAPEQETIDEVPPGTPKARKNAAVPGSALRKSTRKKPRRDIFSPEA